MDSLKKLLSNQQFEAILQKTASSKDPEELFYRVNAYFGLGKDEDGIRLLLANEEVLYEFHPIQFMRLLIEARIALGQFEEAQEDAKRFAQYPYVSQEVEEVLQGLPGYLRAKERESYAKRPKSSDEIRDILLQEKDDFTLLQILNQIQKDASFYQKELRMVVEGERHPMVKTFALLILLSLKDQNEVSLKKNHKTYHVVPAKLKPPYEGDAFKSIMRDISSYTKNTSLNDVAKHLLEEYVITSYPDEVPAEGEEEVLVPALFQLAAEYLQSKEASLLLSQYGEEKRIAIEAEAKAIQNILDCNPPLKY